MLEDTTNNIRFLIQLTLKVLMNMTILMMFHKILTVLLKSLKMINKKMINKSKMRGEVNH
jgi:hypothetical protein